MNQAEVAKLMSQLKIAIQPNHRRLSQPLGAEGRMMKLRKTVTALFKYERIELFHNRADEARGYAERLVSDAIRYGDRDEKMMEMADFWLLEKQLVHKLFKVICPRFENNYGTATKMFNAPRDYPSSEDRRMYFRKVVLELNGNPYPSISPSHSYRNRNLIHNVLLDAAKKEFYSEKARTKATAKHHEEENSDKSPKEESKE